IEVIRIICTSVIGMFGLAAGLEGYMFKRVNVIERLMAIAGGLLLIDPGLITDGVGILLIAAVVVLQLIGRKKAA
ncbi:MAG: FxsA family protein, partial [Treponema sp.]|nr:FxsA family protein [Treponema sp.]